MLSGKSINQSINIEENLPLIKINNSRESLIEGSLINIREVTQAAE